VKRGVTALELMVATTVLALGLVPLLSTQVVNTRQAGFTHAHALAVAQAEGLLDRAAALGWRRLAAGEAAALRVRFEPVSANLASLAAEVTWRSGSGTPERRVRAVRLVARPDGSWLGLP
jgi:hypothetical protein